MSTYPTVVEFLARNASMVIELGGMTPEAALDLAARKSIETATAARTRTGIYAQETSSETIEEVLFYAAVARDVLDGEAFRPSVGNVRQAALDGIRELVA